MKSSRAISRVRILKKHYVSGLSLSPSSGETDISFVFALLGITSNYDTNAFVHAFFACLFTNDSVHRHVMWAADSLVE
jgi:hypothetical protein